MPKTPQTLEDRKLEAEIRKLHAEADRAEFQASTEYLALSKTQAQGPEHSDFLLYDFISNKSVWNAVSGLAVWGRRFPDENLRLVIDSPGGSVIDGLHLYDAIQALRLTHHVTTVGMGMAASMAGILLQAGDVREMSANAFLLIHEVSAGTAGTVTQMRDEAAFLEGLNARGMDLLTARSTLTTEEVLDKIARKDWWLSAEEALEFGFIDQINYGPDFPAAE